MSSYAIAALVTLAAWLGGWFGHALAELRGSHEWRRARPRARAGQLVGVALFSVAAGVPSSLPVVAIVLGATVAVELL